MDRDLGKREGTRSWGSVMRKKNSCSWDTINSGNEVGGNWRVARDETAKVSTEHIMMDFLCYTKEFELCQGLDIIRFVYYKDHSRNNKETRLKRA